MTATNHGLFGAIIAISLRNHPIAAIALAPLSHFLLDALPHYSDRCIKPSSKKFKRRLAVDITLAIASTLAIAWFWRGEALLVVVCAFLAASPDLMWLFYEYLRPTSPRHWSRLARFHSNIQWSQTPSGIIMELAWFVIIFPVLIIVGFNS